MIELGYSYHSADELMFGEISIAGERTNLKLVGLDTTVYLRMCMNVAPVADKA